MNNITAAEVQNLLDKPDVLVWELLGLPNPNSRRNITDVKDWVKNHPNALVVSIYKELTPGMLVDFPVIDIILYAKDVTCREILPFMEPEYKDFHWSLIWTKIRHDRDNQEITPDLPRTADRFSGIDILNSW